MNVIAFPQPRRRPAQEPSAESEQLFARGLAALATLAHGPEQERARAARDVGEALAELARLAGRAA